jgi:hypothetical protein
MRTAIAVLIIGGFPSALNASFVKADIIYNVLEGTYNTVPTELSLDHSPLTSSRRLPSSHRSNGAIVPP